MIRILLVDDDLATLESLQDFLEIDSGIEIVATALSFRQALDLADHIQPDMLITDLHLAAYSGIDLAGKFRARNSRILTIMLSASSDPQDEINALASGINAFVSKMSLETKLIPTIKQMQLKLLQTA